MPRVADFGHIGGFKKCGNSRKRGDCWRIIGVFEGVKLELSVSLGGKKKNE